MKYLVHYFYGDKVKTKRKVYKDINYAMVSEDKILCEDKDMKGILIENKRTRRILFGVRMLGEDKFKFRKIKTK